MKPYGIKHIGPACEWGCCFVQNPLTSPRSRKHGHGATPAHLRAQRNAARRVGAAEANGTDRRSSR